jgi:hypothetical protein
MTPDAYKAAKDLHFKMQKLETFIDTTGDLDAFCNGFGVAEKPETTAKLKELLLSDLNSQLDGLKAEFAKL